MIPEYPFLIRGAADAAFLRHVDDLIERNAEKFRPNRADPLRRRFWSFDDETDVAIAAKKQELVARFGISHWILDPIFKDFVGMISEGGEVHAHTDDSTDQRTHIRINLLIRPAESGCTPLLDSIPLDVGRGDAWVCFSGLCEHATTPVVGPRPRSALSYGLQVELKAAFPLFTKYLAWRATVLGTSHAPRR